LYQYRIQEVRQVLAGDTLVLVLDLGFRISYQVEVKLSNAETTQYGSKAAGARTFTEKWLDPEHGPFMVQTGTDRRGDYYAQIFNASGDDLGDDLVTANLGRLVSS
jgi:hypothetical protein